MKKIFTLAAAVLMGMSMWAVNIYKTDVAETLESPATATINKGAFETLTIEWKGDYTTAFHTTGSAGAIKLTFEPAISLADYSDVKLKVFWGSPSSRPLKVAVNEGELTQIDNIGNSADRKKIREAVGDITETSLTSLNITSSGGGDVYIFRIEITGSAKCEAPASPLTLTADKSEIYAGDAVTLTIAGGNGNETSLTLDGAAFSGTSWTAEKGEHTFAVSQEVKDGICGNTVELKLTVASKDPVTKAEISGSKTGTVGKEMTLSCVAENATAYQWYKGGAKIDGATAADYTFTPDAAGELSFECEASNQYTTTPVKSEAFKVTVAEAGVVCGELIKATMQQEVTGEVGGTVETNLSKGDAQKLNKKKYFGITLKEGEFKEGDKFIVNITVAPDVASKMGTMKLYADKEGAEKVFEADSAAVGVVGENTWKLPASVNGKKSLYIYRGDVDDWNPTFSSVAVVRSCKEESSDATMKSLSINGTAIAAKDGVYPDTIRYEVPLDYDKEDLEIAVVANDENAKAEYAAKVLVPEVGAAAAEVKINITAEDGTKKEYVLVISRPAASDDATIKEVYIDMKLIAAVKDTFSYEVPGDSEMDSVGVQIVLNDAHAVCDKGTDFKILVPQPEAAPTKEVIKVTAQDQKTTKEYVILVSKAKKPEQGIEGVQSTEYRVQKVIRDGQLYILKNGILYNAQGAIVR